MEVNDAAAGMGRGSFQNFHFLLICAGCPQYKAHSSPVDDGPVLLRESPAFALGRMAAVDGACWRSGEIRVGSPPPRMGVIAGEKKG